MSVIASVLIVALVAILAGVIWSQGKGNPIKSGANRSSRSKALRNSIPQLRKIASRYHRQPVGQQAQIFLFGWQRIQEEIKRMGREKRERRLAALYYTRVQPILEAYEKIQKERNT